MSWLSWIWNQIRRPLRYLVYTCAQSYHCPEHGLYCAHKHCCCRDKQRSLR